jgi:hypothetical protein
MNARQNKGRPSITRDAQGARRAARKRDDGGPSNVAQAYRPIEAKNRFQSCRGLRCGGPLDSTVLAQRNRIRKVGFCARSIELPWLVEVVEAQFQLGPAHERGQLPKDDG